MSSTRQTVDRYGESRVSLLAFYIQRRGTSSVPTYCAPPKGERSPAPSAMPGTAASPDENASVHSSVTYKGYVSTLGDQFYATTAINYTNGEPHFGHAYEAAVSDAIARYHRAYGRDVFLLTGTDEHGQKVQQSAEKLGREPIAHCDFYANKFKELDKVLSVSYDRFIRTTDPAHLKTAKDMWIRVARGKSPLGRDNIYLGEYVGWYNRFDEQFVTAAEVELLTKDADGKPLDSRGRPLEEKKEAAYFFRMGDYADLLMKHITTNENFIQPDSSRSEILAFLTNNKLEDLCVSRTTVSWGIPCPVPEPGHTMYVWFDALTNYLTGVDVDLSLDMDGATPAGRKGNSKFWPADVHIIGKDIVRFHTVYWPCMLMAANIDLHHTVFAHGFVTGSDGQKMGKSLGNAKDPLEQLALYGVDALRYYFIRETTFGSDLAFNEKNLVTNYNDLLLKGLGNLTQRSCTTCVKFSAGGRIPEEAPMSLPDTGLPFDLEGLRGMFERCFDVGGSGGGLRLREACVALEAATKSTNAYVDRCAPWKRKGDDAESTTYRLSAVRGALEAVYALLLFYDAFIPDACANLLKAIGNPPRVALKALKADFRNLTSSTVVVFGQPGVVNSPLFQELAVGVGIRPTTNIEETLKRKEEERESGKAEASQRKAIKATLKESNKLAATTASISSVSIRVGKVCEVAAAGGGLYLQKVDVGNGVIVDVASGIATRYKPEELVNRHVCVVLNLEPFQPKAAPDFVSKGMLLAAKATTEDRLELLQPPAGSKPGDVISLSTDAYNPSAGILPVCKPKLWDKAKKSLKIDAASGAILVGDANNAQLGVHQSADAFAAIVAPTLREAVVT